MRALHTTRCLLIAASLILPGAIGQDNDPDHGVVFIYPTADQIYNLMDTVNVTYTSPFPTPNLYTFCDGGGRQVSMRRAPGYNATVPILLNFTSATPCWFNLRPGTEAGFGANSKQFTIIGQERGSGSRVFGPSETPSITPPPYTTSGTGGGGMEPTQTGGSGKEDSSNTGQIDETGPGGSGSSSLSGGASAGIGVGVAVGVLALAGGVFFWWRRQRSRTPGGSRSDMMSGEGDGGGGGDRGEMLQEQYSDDKRYVAALGMPRAYGQSPPLELGTANSAVELTGQTTGTAELASQTTGTGTADQKSPRYEMAG